MWCGITVVCSDVCPRKPCVFGRSRCVARVLSYHSGEEGLRVEVKIFLVRLPRLAEMANGYTRKSCSCVTCTPRFIPLGWADTLLFICGTEGVSIGGAPRAILATAVTNPCRAEETCANRLRKYHEHKTCHPLLARRSRFEQRQIFFVQHVRRCVRLGGGTKPRLHPRSCCVDIVVASGVLLLDGGVFLFFHRCTYQNRTKMHTFF